MESSTDQLSESTNESRPFSIWRDTRHLVLLVFLLAIVGAVAFNVRKMLVPEAFGTTGPYRAGALTEELARPSIHIADATCLECHQNVGEERAESLHKVVNCTHCHGLSRDHVVQARLAAKDPSHEIPKAQEWDGDFFTKIDLFVTKDKATCLSCHEAVVGMPRDFKKIIAAVHLEEMGASEPASRESCFECHGGHDTAP